MQDLIILDVDRRQRCVGLEAGGALVIIVLAILAIIFVPRFIRHADTSGGPAGCAQVGSAYGRYNQAVTAHENSVASNYRQLGDGLDAAAQKATDPNVRSAIQDVADASHAVANDVDEEESRDPGGTSYNSDMSTWSDAHNKLLTVCDG